MNRKGFTVSSIMYPTFIIIITLVVLTLISLIQSTFSINKLVGEIKGDITDNNTMKSLKGNAEDVLKETNSVSTLYNATDGKIYTVDSSGNKTAVNLTGNENTTNWQGQFFTKADGTENMLINNGTYCAYKIGNMSGVAVYNSGTDSVSECAKKIGTDTNCSDVVTLMDNSNTVISLQNQINDLSNSVKTLQQQVTNLQSADSSKAAQISSLQSQVSNLQNDNTSAKNFLKAHPIGSVFITSDGTNPGNYYGGSWSAYAQGRVLIGVGGTSDTNGGYWSFSNQQYGGEFTHRLSVAEMPSHSHSVVTWENYSMSPRTGVKVAKTYDGADGNNTSARTDATGGDQYHNNVQPYVAVYIWRRTN